jgi:transcriptional regulator with XRE-family HTH domain
MNNARVPQPIFESLADPVARRVLIGRRIRWWRQQRQLSQAELARRVGVTQSTLSHYESGKRDPTLGIFCALIAALDVEPAQILKT